MENLKDKIRDHLNELTVEQWWDYGDFTEIRDKDYVAECIYVDVLETYAWKLVSEITPPKHIDVLAKSPEGIIHLCGWREAYNIFTVQNKSESSLMYFSFSVL